MPQLLNRTMTSTSTSANAATATSGQDPAFELDETTTQYLQSRADQLICVACGTQFSETEKSKLANCHICDDRKSLLFHVVLISQQPHWELNACPSHIRILGWPFSEILYLPEELEGTWMRIAVMLAICSATRLHFISSPCFTVHFMC